MRSIGILLAVLIFVGACVYVLFFWRDPAIEQYERGQADDKDTRDGGF